MNWTILQTHFRRNGCVQRSGCFVSNFEQRMEQETPKSWQMWWTVDETKGKYLYGENVSLRGIHVSVTQTSLCPFVKFITPLALLSSACFHLSNCHALTEMTDEWCTECWLSVTCQIYDIPQSCIPQLLSDNGNAAWLCFKG